MQEAQNNDLGVSNMVIQETLEGKQGKKSDFNSQLHSPHETNTSCNAAWMRGKEEVDMAPSLPVFSPECC